MHTKPYPEAKRQIIAESLKHNSKKFLELFGEITGTERKQNLQKILPTLKKGGFKNLDRQIKQQALSLAQRLTWKKEIENPSSQTWQSFGEVWVLWIESKPKLNQVLKKVDNTTDFDENHTCIIPPNSELDLFCFKTLLEKNHNNEIDRETIRRFYDYGYFNEDEQIENLINQAFSLKEIEQSQRLARLPDEIDELSQAVNKLSETVSGLNLLFSTKEFTNKLERQLVQRITEVSQSFDLQFKKLNSKIKKTDKSVGPLLSKTDSNPSQAVESSKRIKALETKLHGLEKSVKSFETKPAVTEITNNMKQKIAQLVKQQIPDKVKQMDPETLDKVKSFEERLVEMENVITEIKSKVSSGPKIAVEALEIGEHHGARLRNQDARYSDEEDYLSVFRHALRRFGVTDSEEEARAIHVAMKAFPALEATDAQTMRVLNMVCGNHLHLTSIDVEMGWLGLQDWFPDLFSQACFKERLEQADLEISIKKMLEVGDMPWIIYLRNCDRSFPEIYLPHFLDWIGGLCGNIKIFLVRTPWLNRCETNEDFYARVARLPEPQNQEPIEVQKLKPRDVVTLTEWASWCLPDPMIDSQYETHFNLLEELRSAVKSRGRQIPIELLREIRHYLRLSHNILAKTSALDWALTIRLLPWIENRRRVSDAVLNLVNESNQELPHFREGLQAASETDE